MHKKIKEILLRRLRIIVVEDNNKTNFLENDKEKYKLAFLSTLSSYGFCVKDDYKFKSSLMKDYNFIINTLLKLKGGHVNYVPLFTNFPDEVPNDDEYFTKRIIGIIGNYFGLFEENSNSKKLENGMIVPNWLFNLNNFGADPISQFQTKEMYEKGLENQKSRNVDDETIWSEVKIVFENEVNDIIKEYFKNIFYSKSSIKETMKEDIEKLLEYFNINFIDGNKISFKETKAYLLKYFWKKEDYNSVSKLLSSSTDILRLFAALTDGDISLAEKIKFPKLKRSQRKFIISSLNNFSNLEEDLYKYKNLWLSISRGLHVGEYSNKYKKTYYAFQNLMNNNIKTWNFQLQNAINNLDEKETFSLLLKRPGEFLRNLHYLLRVFPENVVIDNCEKIIKKVPLKNLFILEKYFSSYNDIDKRTVINKKGKIISLEKNCDNLKKETLNKLHSLFSKAIVNKIKNEKELWPNKKVWIDENLKNYIAPISQRKASEAFLSAERGTRIPFKNDKVIRTFVYWTENSQRTDLDLSMVSLDSNMKYINHVSYTNLKNEGVIHSGDLQSAPYGAAEFIDVNFSSLNKKVKYLVPQVYLFCGEPFPLLQECFVGWMVRNKINSTYKSFDVKTVENAFVLNSNSKFSIPFIIDIENKEIIYTDLYVSNPLWHSNVENSITSIEVISKSINEFIFSKPNMFETLLYNIIGRGALTIKNKKDADITIGIKDCDYNVNELEKFMSNFM